MHRHVHVLILHKQHTQQLKGQQKAFVIQLLLKLSQHIWH